MSEAKQHVYVSDQVKEVERLHRDLLTDDVRRLPIRDQLDRQAHRILEGQKAGDRAVVTHITCWHPTLVCHSADEIMTGPFTLDDARQTIAREYGFADWSDVGECHENDGVHRSSGRIYKVTHGRPKPWFGFDLAQLTRRAAGARGSAAPSPRPKRLAAPFHPDSRRDADASRCSVASLRGLISCRPRTRPVALSRIAPWDTSRGGGGRRPQATEA